MKKEIIIELELKGRDRLDYADTLFLLILNYVKVISRLYGELSNRQIDVTSAFLYLDNMYKQTYPDEDIRWSIVTGRPGRERAAALLGIGENNLNNIITNLRKKDIFVGGKIIEPLRVYTDGDLKLVINFERKDLHN